jgi:hypothetical protein
MRQHLLFAAREGTGPLRSSLPQDREQLEDPLEAVCPLPPRVRHVAAQIQVLANRQVGKDSAALRHVSDAQFRDTIGRPSSQTTPSQCAGAGWRASGGRSAVAACRFTIPNTPWDSGETAQHAPVAPAGIGSCWAFAAIIHMKTNVMVQGIVRPGWRDSALSSRVGLAALITYLTIFMVWGGPLTSRVWAQGGHVTTEHWSYHAVFERLGITHHHHIEAEDSHADGEGPSSENRVNVVLTAAVFQISVGPIGSTTTDTTLHQLFEASSGLIPIAVGSQALTRARPIPTGLRLEPPTKPPSLAR